MALSSVSRFFSSFCCHPLSITKEHCKNVAAVIAIAAGCFLALAGIGIMVQGVVYGFSGHVVFQSIALAERIGAMATFLLGGGSFVGGVALACGGGRMLL